MSASLREAGQLQQEEETSGAYDGQYYQYNHSSNSVSEIEEENSSELFEINHGMRMVSIPEEELDNSSMFSFDAHCNSKGEGGDCVYVCVGKSESSMDALSWTLKKWCNESTMVYLIHVFPEIHHIPSPLGKLPKSQVSPEQVENYMAQERGKRRELLHKFINMCSASKVKVDTMLIESDMASKAILELIPILNIRKLVLGTNKSSLRKLRSRRGTGIADQILQNAPQYCEVKMVCDGKEVIEQVTGLASPRGVDDGGSNKPMRFQDQSNNDSFACMCFKTPKLI